ncbi:MAG TPA: hypothetical protein VMP01_27360 [Pirellulaceae bacterium]|nr:hypothetical protein [Pirellulaceae bacterium]
MMRRIFAAVVISVVAAGAVANAAESLTDKVLDDFVAAVKENKEAKTDAITKAVEIVTALRAEPDARAVAITEGLRELYPEFRDALGVLGEENLDAAITALGKLRDAADPYLAAEASYYLARAYLLQERFEDALPILEDAGKKWAGKTTRDGEALFLRGVAYGQLLAHQEATECLTKFLSDYPDAPERMRVGAFRQLEVLKLYQEGTLTDVQLRMDYSRRKLSLADTGQTTREQQDKIIDILAKLIKEAEERECNCKGGGKGSKQGQKQGEGSESEGQGQGQSQGGSQGGNSKGTDTDTVKRLHRGGPQSPWSHLRDRDRDPVYSAIKEKYPARYQQLIEQYYKSFSEDEG